MWMLLAGCAPSRLEVRVAQLEQQLAASDALIADHEQRISDLSERLQTKKEEHEAGVVGKDALFVAQEWVQGSTELAEHKATMLVFWEEWCPHCKREVPALQAKADAFAPKGLGMVGITQMTRGAGEAKVKKFLADNGVRYPILKDDGTMSEHYGVSGVPAAALVKDGKVVWRGHPARLNDTMIEATLR